MVGGSAAFAAVMTAAASEIVHVDVNEKLAQPQGEDHYAHPVRVSAGNSEELGGAGVVLICCGVAQRPGETRLQLLKRNAAIFSEVILKSGGRSG
jgi:L-lactate dehydrogenase